MAKICFIAGHGKSKKGGYDSGAVSKDGKFHEFKIVKKIAKHAQTYYNSTYTEQADCMNYDGDLYLSERIKEANSNNYDFVAEIHLNAGGGTGVECYYSKGNAKGQKYADMICKNISNTLGIKQRSNGKDDGGDKVKLNSSGDDYFGIIRQTEMTSVLVECAFIDTELDLSRVNSTEGQKMCGEAIAKAVAEVRGLRPKVDADKIKVVYRVQTGAFSSLDNAKKQMEKIKKAGFPCVITLVEKLYRVQVGAFSVKENAVNCVKSLERAGMAGFITTAVGKIVNLDRNKTIEEIADEVIAGKWGNGQDRINRLTKSGYDASVHGS